MTNEKRLIDANATLAGVEAFMQCYAEKEKELTPFWIKVATQALDMVRQFIKEMPTVDAVEVVRCKECKYFDKLFKGEGVVNKIGTCHLRDEEGIETAQVCNDFCSYGERREEE